MSAGRISLAIGLLACCLIGVDQWLGARSESGYDPEAFIAAARDYDAEIVRDPFGVPHIFGERDADVAFGLAWAHAEDDIATIESNLPLYRAQSAKRSGTDGLAMDYLVQWLGAADAVDARYSSDLSPEVRAVLEAWAHGLNYYAAMHPDEVDPSLYPVTARDLVIAFSVQHLFFYGFQRTLQELFAESRQRDIATGPQAIASALYTGDIPVGSNAMAVAPSRSTDGATRLLGNSHQPLTGPLSWYEVQLHSRAGWHVRGGLFPGSPVVTIGTTPTLGWGVTVNQPDLVDVYVLDVDPEDPTRYRLDGEWVEFERRTAVLPVKLVGNLYWTLEREILESVHGPVLETDHGFYALRFAGYGEIRQAEQWYRMNRARTFEQWRDAMRLGAIASFNFVYADAEGHIGHFHNSRSPVRAAGWDWKAYLPGDRSDLLWDRTQTFDENPAVVDPPSGYVLSANQTPWRVTSPADDVDRAQWAPEFGYPERMTNRAWRGLELLEADASISREEFEAIKFDHRYSRDSRSAHYVEAALQADFSHDPRLHQAQQFLRDWDLGTDIENRHARLGTCVLAQEWIAEQRREAPPPATSAFEECVLELHEHFGGVDVRWGDVNRLVQGRLDLPINGGPDVLRAIYGTDPDGDGILHAAGGDGLVVMSEWDAEGRLHLRTIHQFGSAITRPESVHHTDQMEAFASEQFKPAWFREAEVRAVATSSTRVPLRESGLDP